MNTNTNKINPITGYFYLKPLTQEDDKQLFSFDAKSNGSKNFLFKTYSDIYQTIIKSDKPYYYEDNTFTKSIKLFIDYDQEIIFKTPLQRDKYAQKISESILKNVNEKLYSLFKIQNTPIIVLISDTLTKMSLHIIFTDIIFQTVYQIKHFMQDISLIDQSVYKTGCFRMLYCSKFARNNKLIYSHSYNYTYPTTDYQFFLDTSICYTENKQLLPFEILTQDIKNQYTSRSKNNKIHNIPRNYTYQNIDFDILQTTLDKLIPKADNYIEWLTISLSIKDLYLSTQDTELQQKIYTLYDTFSQNSPKYNKERNKQIFDSLNPKIDINYLFKMANEKHYFLPFYNYQELIFNHNKHTNIDIKDEKYINIQDLESLIKYKYICIKSPTGSGKTRFLKQIIQYFKIENILSITSRVNLAGEHMKELFLQFYGDLNYQSFYNCQNLVIQLESLAKCNYKLFKNGIVILDEVNSLLSHIRSPTMNNKRHQVYLYLVEIIKNSQYVISLDADLADWNIQFLQDIHPADYFVYYNINKNKLGTDAIIYKSTSVIINTMQSYIINNTYFISCFDSLREMNETIKYLSQFGNKNEWIIYSSEIDYKIINTQDWINKFVFFTPTIIYGIDFSHQEVDAFSFTYKNHLNSLQIYQMMSRSRKQHKLHVYCHQTETTVKYKSVQSVVDEVHLCQENLNTLLPNYEQIIDIDDTAYRTMYYNHTYIDSILKTNTKAYLIDMLINKGYQIQYNDTEPDQILHIQKIPKNIKQRIIDLLIIDKNKLSILENKLATDDIILEKYFNLRLFLNNTDNTIDEKIINSIGKNLFVETLTNKYTKIKLCKQLMNLLQLDNLQSLDEEISKYFSTTIKDEWFEKNVKAIKKTFDIRGVKYESLNFYNTYTLLIAMFRSLFDQNLFTKQFVWFDKVQYNCFTLNDSLFTEYTEITDRFDKKYSEVDFIDEL